MNEMAGYPSFRRRLLANMPEDVASSFTELQLEMLEHALAGGKWRDHPVDVRLSIPVLWRRFYFVLLAGAEFRRLRGSGPVGRGVAVRSRDFDPCEGLNELV